MTETFFRHSKKLIREEVIPRLWLKLAVGRILSSPSYGRLGDCPSIDLTVAFDSWGCNVHRLGKIANALCPVRFLRHQSWWHGPETQVLS